jgi:hypothetical protein
MNKTLLKFAALILVPFGITACSKSDNAKLTELQKDYPLANCPVSGAKLGEMGKPVDYLYQHPDANNKSTTELVRFCCPGCIAKFNAEPDQYLQKIHAAK